MKHSIKRIKLLLLLPLLPMLASAQTTRGDFDYDGQTTISDLTFLINYLLTDQWNEEPADLERDTVIVNGVSFVMVHVDGGSYQQADGATVTVGDFWIGKTEVTQELWQAVMGSNPSRTRGTNRPVEQVSWDDCQEFISLLNGLTGKTFRLPYSAEWEFAARGGNRSRGYMYSGSNNPDLVARYKGSLGDSNMTTNNVTRLTCNELGLYDMSGNVNEWCHDGKTGSNILRGGCFYHGAANCRVTWSSYYGSSMAIWLNGMRLAI